MADEAVARLVLPERTGDLTTPARAAEWASERARAHAAWWDGLSDDQRQALIQTYPDQIGLTDGIPALARHEANSLSFQHLLDDRNELQARVDAGASLTDQENDELAYYDRLETALNRATDAAHEAGVGGPYLLEFDPDAFDGRGRVLVSFGDDPYRAQAVSWHIPGRGITIDHVGPCMGYALNHLTSTLAENPELSAASIAWIGHDTEGEDAPRVGGEILYNDVRVFNAVHDVTAADGGHFSNNNMFGHCQGSTVTGYAGEGGRLGSEVRTVTLMGSPGAGPIEHASEFGVGDNVFVASSSRDPFTEEGGQIPGSSGRVGAGVDPAMDFFGAQRLTSEFPRGTDPLELHNSYYKFEDRSVGQRSESLANLGRIAAGHPERVNLEGRRTAVELPGQEPHTLDPAAGRPAETLTGDDVAAVASEALAQRVSPLDIHEFVNPLGDAQAAGERAFANAAWWDGLNAEQQHALIETYPDKIGNAEGIPLSARHEANSRSLQDWLSYRDQLQSKLDSGEGLTAEEGRDLDRFNEIEAALQEAGDTADRQGVGGPYLLAFDPLAFGGEGRAIVSFGDDPYLADSVSWHVPGMGMTLDGLGPFMDDALNHLESTRREDSSVSAASIAWVGYDTLAESDGAQAGGEILHSDLYAFNSARDGWAADSGHFSGNHVFGHSQGATVAGYAGRDGRLAGVVDTVTLVGPEGVGPIAHASDFGLGDNVYVASSSHDSFTERADGVDPAMDSFGAQRVTAEYPRGAEPLDAYRAYYEFADETEGQRNESLANFGRIAAGHPERVALEEHRTVVEQPDHTSRVHDPAAERPVLLEDPLPTSVEPVDNCAYDVVDDLSARYGREFRIDVEPGPNGVPARALFEAVRSGAKFASYDEVHDELAGMESGSSAVLASRWAEGGEKQGGHAYLAVNENGVVRLRNLKTGESEGWPPSWGEGAVSRTAVAYLDEHGDPPPELRDNPDRSAADAIGDVQGLRDDPDFPRRQEDYRAQNLTRRRVDARYADPVGEVLDNVSDPARIHQLARDLSGKYGPYRIELTGRELNGEIMLVGEIFRGNTHIGEIQREFGRDGDGNLVAYHTGLSIDDEKYRGRGFSKALTSELERYYIGSGVDRIELGSHAQGSYAWARRGFTWDPDPESLQSSLDSIKNSARELLPWVSGDAQEVLRDVIERLEPDHPRLPELIELASLTAPGEPDLGRQLLDETRVNFVKYLRGPLADEPIEQSGRGFRAWMERHFGSGSDARSLSGDESNDSAHSAVGKTGGSEPVESQADPAVTAVALDALSQRIPPVDVNELVNPLGDEPAAVERAGANAAWWDSAQRRTAACADRGYPDKIGNSEGIPAGPATKPTPVPLDRAAG